MTKATSAYLNKPLRELKDVGDKQMTHTHTPGPWEANGTNIVNPKAPLLKPCEPNGIGGQIAEVTGLGNKDHDTQLANARLIAASPDLLSALKVAETEMTHDVPRDCWATGPLTGDAIRDLSICPGCIALVKIRAAIDKATGE